MHREPGLVTEKAIAEDCRSQGHRRVMRRCAFIIDSGVKIGAYVRTASTTRPILRDDAH